MGTERLEKMNFKLLISVVTVALGGPRRHREKKLNTIGILNRAPTPSMPEESRGTNKSHRMTYYQYWMKYRCAKNGILCMRGPTPDLGESKSNFQINVIMPSEASGSYWEAVENECDVSGKCRVVTRDEKIVTCALMPLDMLLKLLWPKVERICSNRQRTRNRINICSSVTRSLPFNIQFCLNQVKRLDVTDVCSDICRAKSTDQDHCSHVRCRI